MKSQFTKTELIAYRQRLQNYIISREFFASLYREGFITEIEFHFINLQLLMKYDLPEKSVYNTKDI